jgi:hypothetical protein
LRRSCAEPTKASCPDDRPTWRLPRPARLDPELRWARQACGDRRHHGVRRCSGRHSAPT